MTYDHFVLSDQHARLRQQEILREVVQIRLAKQVAAKPQRTVQRLLTLVITMLQR